MKSLKILSIWFFGFMCGIVLIILFRNSNNNLKNPVAEVGFKNSSDFIITKITIHEDKYDNNYLIENLKPNQQQKIFLFTNGEIGYYIFIEYENGDTLSTGGYAESGYRDFYIIKKDSIIFKPFTSY